MWAFSLGGIRKPMGEIKESGILVIEEKNVTKFSKVFWGAISL